MDVIRDRWITELTQRSTNVNTVANAFPGVDGVLKRGHGDVPDARSMCSILNYIWRLANKLLLPMLTHALPGVRLLQKLITVRFHYLGDALFHHNPKTSIVSIALFILLKNRVHSELKE